MEVAVGEVYRSNGGNNIAYRIDAVTESGVTLTAIDPPYAAQTLGSVEYTRSQFDRIFVMLEFVSDGQLTLKFGPTRYDEV